MEGMDPLTKNPGTSVPGFIYDLQSPIFNLAASHQMEASTQAFGHFSFSN